jgi:hypothetical protein
MPSVWANISLEQVKRLQRNGTVEHEISIFWVPRRTLVSNSILEEAGVIGDVNIADMPLYFVPLEQDVLSLELGDSFGDLYLVRALAHRIERTVINTIAEQRPRLCVPCSKSAHGHPAKTWVLPAYHWQG